MVSAKLTFIYVDDDREMERTAWQTSLLMSASGNYGKKGIDPKKLYVRRFDDLGNPVKSTEGQNAYTPINPEVKAEKLSELMAKFNKE